MPHFAPEDLGIFYTMVSIFFIVSGFTIWFAKTAMKGNEHGDH